MTDQLDRLAELEKENKRLRTTLDDLFALNGGRNGWEVGRCYISRSFVDTYDTIYSQYR